MQRPSFARTPCVALAVVLLFGAGCSGEGDARGAGDAADGEVVVAFQSGWDGLDPFQARTDRSRLILQELLGVPLLRRDPGDGALRPWLVETVPRLEGLEAIFVLRSEARWPDGAPVTPRDVRATWDEAVRRGRPGLYAEALAGVTAIEVLDERRFRLRLDAAAPAQLRTFGRAFVVRRAGAAPSTSDDEGLGPFRVLRQESGELTLERRRAWWGDEVDGIAERFRVDRLRLRVVDDQTALPRLLAAGDVELAALPAEVAREGAPAGVELESFASTSYSFVGWNARRPPFDSAALRRALGASVPRRRLADALDAIPLDGSFLPGEPDREEARADLVAMFPARAAPGAPPDFELLVPAGTIAWADAVTSAWRERLRQAGIELRIERLELRALLDRLERGAFDAFLLVFTAEDGALGFAPLLRSQDGRTSPPNFGGHASVELDAALAALATAAGTGAGDELALRLAEIVRREAPVTFLFRHRAWVAWRPDHVTLAVGVHGVDWSSLAAPPSR